MSPVPEYNPAVAGEQLASLAGQLFDPKDREQYAALISYINSLPPSDEMVKVAQLIGFLTLIGQELPKALSQERKEQRKMMVRAYRALLFQVTLMKSYHDQLQERLTKLPDEIAKGVNFESAAKALRDSIGRQLDTSGVKEAKTLVSTATNDLRKTIRELAELVRPLSEQYGNIPTRKEQQAAALDPKVGKLAPATTQNQKKTKPIQERLGRMWSYYSVVALLLILSGMLLGIAWDQRGVVISVQSLQQEISDLQQTIRASTRPTPIPAPGSKHPKNH